MSDVASSQPRIHWAKVLTAHGLVLALVAVAVARHWLHLDQLGMAWFFVVTNLARLFLLQHRGAIATTSPGLREGLATLGIMGAIVLGEHFRRGSSELLSFAIAGASLFAAGLLFGWATSYIPSATESN